MTNNNLINMLDSFSETGVYVIERETYKLLYFNRHVQEISPQIKLGMKCHEMWPQNCINCPLKTIEGKKSSHSICYDDPFGKMVDVIANRVMWEETIPAYVIIVTPHKLNSDEEQELKLIEKMYAESLVTVFDEYIIANLTDDYYVNCQKDMLWSDLPHRGGVDEGNGLYAQKLIHPEDLDIFFAAFTRSALLQYFAEGKKYIMRRIRRLSDDGTYRMVEYNVTHISHYDDNACWCIMMIRDINEEYLQEQKKNMEIGQLATAARIAYQMLISANLSQNTYYMMEYDKFETKKADREGDFDELIAVGAATVDPDFREEFIRKFSRKGLLEAFAKGEKQITMELRQLGDDGVYHWNSTQVVRIESPYTKDIIEITMTKNIDEERRAQEEALDKEKKTKQILEDALVQAKKASMAKSDFMSKMSHDIRTPLNAILGMTELAQVYVDDKEKLQDYLSKIETSGKHLLGLINDVLDVSKIESGKEELQEIEFDIKKLAQDVVSMVQPGALKKEQKLSLTICEGTHKQVRGDENKIRQILVNVLENASKYTDIGGKASLTVKELTREEKRTGTYQFIIEDNGIGMKQEYINHIFEPFSREDDSRISKIIGTGLGMTIVHRLITNMGGTIEVESEYGKGSRFIISLCLSKSVNKDKISSNRKKVKIDGMAGLRILVAEDNEMNQEIIMEMLKLLEVEAEIVNNGREAVEAVNSHQPYYYNLVLMDIQMPVMNGYDAAMEIRKLERKDAQELPIIALTADAFSEDVKRTRLVGMNGHMAKPVSMIEIKKCLEEYSMRSGGKREK